MSTLVAAALILGSPAIECPKYLPGTDITLPEGVDLSHNQNVANLMRCYCEVVVPAEASCKERDSPAMCREATNIWIRENILSLMSQHRVPQPPTRQWRVISIEP